MSIIYKGTTVANVSSSSAETPALTKEPSYLNQTSNRVILDATKWTKGDDGYFHQWVDVAGALPTTVLQNIFVTPMPGFETARDQHQICAINQTTGKVEFRATTQPTDNVIFDLFMVASTAIDNSELVEAVPLTNNDSVSDFTAYIGYRDNLSVAVINSLFKLNYNGSYSSANAEKPFGFQFSDASGDMTLYGLTLYVSDLIDETFVLPAWVEIYDYSSNSLISHYSLDWNKAEILSRINGTFNVGANYFRSVSVLFSSPVRLSVGLGFRFSEAHGLGGITFYVSKNDLNRFQEYFGREGVYTVNI